MLNFFRSFLKSKLGAVIGLLVLGVIAIAFASGDIAGFNSSSGVSAGTPVVTVGGESVNADTLDQGAKRALERVRQQSPNVTMKVLLEQGGLEQVLGELIDRTALFAFGTKNGVTISDRLVDSELAQIPAFQGVDGKFDQTVFRQALAQQRISEPALRDDIRESLVARELVTPAQIGSTMSQFAAKRYASLLDETRTGTAIALPSLLFAPDKQPTDADLAAFYKGHSAQFIRPERRTIRYAVVSEDQLKAAAPPTDAEIAARFTANKAAYAAKDNRRITQLIVPTEAAAKAVVAEVEKGKGLEAAAQEKGLSAARLEFFSRDDLSTQFSPAVAQAVFAAPLGKLAAPQKSVLGWHVIRVDEEQKTPARTLAEVKSELSTQVAADKRRKAFSDTLAAIEEQFSDGSNLNEVAKSVGGQVQTTQPVTADGGLYMKPGQTLPEQLRPVLTTAFSMDQEQPQVAEVERGKSFVIYDVTAIAPSAPAPLAQIKDDVKLAWAVDIGSKAAKAAALKMQADIRKGKTAEQVMAASGKKLPPPQQVAMSRATLAAALRSGRQVPPPVSLMFHMAKTTVKVQSAEGERGWFVVQLKDIVPGKVESEDMVKNTQNELGQQLGQAYADALGHAVRKAVGVKRNDAAIKAVRDQLAGTASAN
ncbi:peptidylprolyl isomerase [Novosphingobium sp. P6W]|uniref:peptidylprolyl isomerase n=1 Tax=Novosphingobium sp. P6W TaxID=1609758 RepID=UPI0005C2DB18|nr:peptidylprolyl isomerase [Novosphingobium sp. P6W]AXB76521.1 peptidylprolyl isomerase [Novosphingobium sp. P6W]KIS30768.1 peptidylprolyl isomerase [Novosphingobium sp. P6W]